MTCASRWVTIWVSHFARTVPLSLQEIQATNNAKRQENCMNVDTSLIYGVEMADLFMISAILPRDALTMFRLFLLTMYKISHFRLSSNIFKTMSRLSWSVSTPRLGCLGALGDEVAAAAAGLADFWMPGTFSPRTCKQKSGYMYFKE